VTKRKRALFLINSLTGGGAERVMCTLLRHSEPERAEFDISLAVLDNEPAGNAAPAWVDLHQFDCRFSLMRSVVAVRRAYAELKPDVSLSFLTRANLASLMSARTPCVVSERAHTSHHLGKGLRGAVSRTMVRTIYPRAAKVIAVSDGVARDLRDNFGVPRDKVVSIPNPVDAVAIQAKAKEAAPVIDGPFIMSAGRLVGVKNFAMLIRAFAAAPGKRKLVIAGEGEDRRALETLARELGVADRVILPGFMANPYPLMSAADIFILSSNSEGYPNALIEGMAVGRPVISTNCNSGPSEILANKPRSGINGLTFAEHGVLVPVGDEEAMAEAIRALDDPRRRAEYGAKAEARAGAFSAAAIKDSYWDVLRAAMNAAPARQR
jgi:N-acetylgalactosamine-N,N'-diacetylbacillosaminyl-diphospho-undecaprenol 4-alpha-N-acetylgalactosaminyltransferase